MSDLFVSTSEDVHTSTGNAGTLGDPMGLVEAIDAASAGDRILVMGTDEPSTPDYEVTSTITPSAGGTVASPIEIVGANASGVIDGTRPHIGTTASTSNTETFDFSSTPFIKWRNLVLGNASNRSVFTDADGHTFENVLGLGDSHTSDAHLVDAGAGDRGCVFLSCEARQIGSPSGSFCLVRGDSGVFAIDCKATGGALLLQAFTQRMGITMIGCEAVGATSTPYKVQLTQAGLSLIGCIARDTDGADGFSIGDASFDQAMASLVGCLATGNSGAGFAFPNNGNALLDACVAYGNTGYGFEINSPDNRVVSRACYAGGNTAGDLDGSLYSGSIGSLSADPFVDAAGGDYTLDLSSTAGLALRDLANSYGMGRASAYPFRSRLETIPAASGAVLV